jgi:hypothetical protein
MRVFISHSDSDQELARKIGTRLKDSGLEVWDKSGEILPGDNWAAKVAQALEESDAMVVLLTPDALRSDWVRREIEYALGEERYSNRLIPVLVGSSEDLDKAGLPWILKRLRAVALLDPDKEETDIREIAQALLNDS